MVEGQLMMLLASKGKSGESYVGIQPQRAAIERSYLQNIIFLKSQVEWRTNLCRHRFLQQALADAFSNKR